MLFTKKYYSKYLLILGITAITVLLCPKVTGEENTVGYQESIYLHLCRNTFVTGEIVWYRAYCFARGNTGANFMSKALYVEILNSKNVQVLGQIVEIESGTAASSIKIPDTLSSGLYRVRAYTQWMRNAGPGSFFSCSVYIYNEFNEDNDKRGLRVGVNPGIFIEGGRLINNIPVKIYMNKILSPDAGNIFIYNASSNRKVAKFSRGPDGQLEAGFVPADTANYEVIIGEISHPDLRVELPWVERIGARINILRMNDKGVVFKIIATPETIQECILSARYNGTMIARTVIDKENFNKEISLPMSDFLNKSIDFILQAGNDKIIAKKTCIFSDNHFKNTGNTAVYKTRSKVTVDVGSLPFVPDPGSRFSVSVHKESSSLFTNNDIEDYKAWSSEGGTHLLVNSEKGWSEIVPVPDNDEQMGSYHNPDYRTNHNREILPVEEKGIVLTGNVINSATGNPMKGIDVLLAINDTIPEIQSYRTDSMGRFAFLLENNSKPEAIVRLYKNLENLKEKYTIHFDSKYEASPPPRDYMLNYTFDSSFIEMIGNEAQREKILKAFATAGQPVVVPPVEHKWSFYGTPEITVYPDQYSSLSNFEEISREIVPKVKFRETRNGYTAQVNSDTESVYSTTPLVLLDGIPIVDVCEIYPLNSDDVYRIDVQGGRRVSGNLLYNGLIAIYATIESRKAIEEKIKKEIIHIPYYYKSPSFDQIRKTEFSDITSKRPGFLNQLYWNPALDNGKTSSGGFEFYTSDEEGEYIIDIQGVESDGTAIHYQRKFKVED